MSDNTPVAAKATDFNVTQLDTLIKFKEAGLPGVSRINETSIFQWFNLYLAGKNYDEIATICKSEPQHVLYIADKFNWFEKKMGHYNGILTKLDTRVQAVKLESADFVLDVITMIHRAHGGKITEFLQTGNRELLKDVNLGVLDKYFKSIDALGKLLAKPLDPLQAPPQPVSPVTINMGDAKIEQKEDGSIEITAKSSLKDVAKKKRQTDPTKP
jgi:hypothetical protein